MVLDYGCGGSAYRPLFGNCTYHRASLSGGSNLDFEYCPDAKWLRSASHELVNLLPRLAEGVLIVDDYGAQAGVKRSSRQVLCIKETTVHKGDRDPSCNESMVVEDW